MTDMTPFHGAIRSLPRQSARVTPSRKRAYVLRYGVVLVSVGVLLAVTIAVGWQMLPKRFPFVLLYFLHDTLWLWLRGHLWTARFPYALVWAIPVTALIIAGLVELLTPFSVRTLHRRVLVMLMNRGLLPMRARVAGPAEMAERWDQPFQQPPPRPGGFARLVAAHEQVARWQAVRNSARAGEIPSDSDFRALLRSCAWWLHLDPASPQAQFAALEALALCDPRHSGALLRRMTRCMVQAQDHSDAVAAVQFAATALSTGDDAAMAEIVRNGVQRLKDRISGAGSGPVAPVTLAVNAVLAGTLALRSNHTAGQDVFDLFAQARLMPEPETAGQPSLSQSVAMAMALIDFAFWAECSERGSLSANPPQDPYFNEWVPAATRAERFASKGLIQ